MQCPANPVEVDGHSATVAKFREVAAADDATALAFQQLLADRWATATAEQTTRDAGQPGVRLRCYLDLRQQLTAAAVAGATMEPTTARP
ncbi:DUF6207 family protein [Streptomyces luteogriseus]|uniref:DUF6207 family protein n=1 Tax=Streptomyces ossamyceticus TaxID=249581 RepID=A0ABV2V5K9_9ACTN